MLSVDTSQLRVKEPLPGWKGRFFKSANMTFGYYSVSAGASIHEHSHANEEVWHVLEATLRFLTADKPKSREPAVAHSCRRTLWIHMAILTQRVGALANLLLNKGGEFMGHRLPLEPFEIAPDCG